MISWPAVLQYRGDNELVFIAGQLQWDSDTELSGGSYDADDRLIDSKGMVFRTSGQVQELLPVNQSVTLDEMIELVRFHMSEVGLCCVSKFSADSIEEAIVMVSTFAE